MATNPTVQGDDQSTIRTLECERIISRDPAG